MRYRKNFVKAAMACLVFVFASNIDGFAETGTGSAEVVLQGGNQGNVSFPHRRHQQSEPPNCQRCHALFPQAQNAIALSKQEGKLGPMQVMNGLCIKCHQEAAAAGKPSGPRTCTVCHAIK